MKKFGYVAFSVLLSLLTGCSEQELNEASDVLTFSEFTVSMAEAIDTRTYFEADNSVVWSNNDRIGLFSDIQDVEVYYIDGEPDGSNAKFWGNPISGKKFYAFYPFTPDYFNPSDRMKLKAEFWGGWMEGNTIDLPMVAISNSNNLQFRQVCGIFKFTLTGKNTIRQLSLRSNNGEIIRGTGYIDLTEDVPLFKIDTSDEYSYVFNYCVCFNDLEPGVPVSYYFPVPVITLEKGFSLRIDGTDKATGEEFTLVKSIGEPITIHRAEIISFSDIDTDAMLEEGIIHVAAVKLKKTSLELKSGDIEWLFYEVVPVEADNYAVNWSSSNPNVATVDECGNVKAISEGTATITVTSVDGNKTDSCVVTVKQSGGNGSVEEGGEQGGDRNVAVTDIMLDKNQLNLVVGGIEQLTAVISPLDATNQNVTWESSNPSIATVDEDGNVNAVSTGTATITATTEDGGKTATCQVNVSTQAQPQPYTMVTKIVLNTYSVTVGVKETVQLTATAYPVNATNRNVLWSTSNSSIASVDPTGKVTGQAEGTATISVVSADGNAFTTCEVTVLKQGFYPGIDKMNEEDGEW